METNSLSEIAEWAHLGTVPAAHEETNHSLWTGRYLLVGLDFLLGRQRTQEATTAVASSRVSRYCGIGGRAGRSLYARPVIRNLIASLSSHPGRPAIFGVLSAQAGIGTAGLNGNGDPWSHFSSRLMAIAAHGHAFYQVLAALNLRRRLPRTSAQRPGQGHPNKRHKDPTSFHSLPQAFLIACGFLYFNVDTTTICR